MECLYKRCAHPDQAQESWAYLSLQTAPICISPENITDLLAGQIQSKSISISASRDQVALTPNGSAYNRCKKSDAQDECNSIATSSPSAIIMNKNEFARDRHPRSYAAALQQTLDSVKEVLDQNARYRYRQVQHCCDHPIDSQMPTSRCSCFDEIPEAATRAAVSSGIGDPFHYDWPHWY